MPAVSFSKTGTAPEDTSWDWSAETQNAILGPDGDDWALYKAAHAWWDGSTGDDAQKKAPYKLPHHRKASGGGLEAVWHGVSNAMARLQQSDIPDDEMKAAFDHLAKHYAQWEKKPPEWERFIAEVHARRAQSAANRIMARSGRGDTRALIMATQAAIPLLAGRVRGQPTADDMTLINRMSRSPLDPDRVYVVPAEISSTRVDSYYTQMTPATLQRYVADSCRGVSFLDSHDHYRLPIGRSFYGEVVRTAESADVLANGRRSNAAALNSANASAAGGTVLTAQSLAYLLRGMRLSNGMTSDDVIDGIEASIYHDISVGFIPDSFWCSICHLDMLNSYDCMHIPGMTYQTESGDEVVCVAFVDAGLAEYSLVYKGATPGASVLGDATDTVDADTADADAGRAEDAERGVPNIMVMKVEREMALGRAQTPAMRFVEDTCHVRLYGRWPGYGAGTNTSTMTAAALAAATAGDESRAGAPAGNEEEDMRGSEMVLAVIERAGAEVSAGNLARLRDIASNLQTGHDTLSDGVAALSAFIVEKDRSANGDNQPPESVPGNGEADEAAALSEQLGNGSTGDVADAHPPSSIPTAEPGSDDGDGDDDQPSRADESAVETADSSDSTEERVEEAVEEGAQAEEAPAGAEARDDMPYEPDGDTHSAMTGEHSHGKYGKHSHSDSADHSDAPLKNANADASTEEREAAEADVVARADVLALPEEQRMTAEEAALLLAGRQAVVTVREEAMRAGARALGPAFDGAMYQRLLERATYDELVAFRDTWQAQAQRALGTKGEFTPDRSQPGGGSWSSEPTGRGGRQTVARNPNDPASLVANGGARLTPAAARVSAPRQPAPASTRSEAAPDGSNAYRIGPRPGQRSSGARRPR